MVAVATVQKPPQCISTLNLYEFAFCFYDYFMAFTFTHIPFIFDFHPITRMANRQPKESGRKNGRKKKLDVSIKL